MPETSTAISYVVLAGTSIYSLYQIRGALDFPQFSLGLIVINSAIGTYKCLVSEEGGDLLNKTHRFTSFLQSIFSLPCMATASWLQHGYQKELAWAHTGVSLIPLLCYLLDSDKDGNLVELITLFDTISMGVVTFLAQNYWGLGAAAVYGFAHFCVRKEGDFADKIPAQDLYNYCLAVFAYCAYKGLTVAGPGGRLLVTNTRPDYLGQIIASFCVSLGTLTAGLGKGYSSPAIASLQQSDADAFPVSGQQASWLASLSVLGALFGAPLGGLAVRWGRRRALLIAGPPLALCWLLIAFSASVETMCLAAFLSGLLIAVVQVAAQIYVSEVAAPDIRGGLSGVLKVAGHAGVLVAYSAGAFLNWRQLAALISLAPAAMFVALLRIPESPGFLVLRGHDVEAEAALRWLRGNSADLRFELAVLQTHVMRRSVSNGSTVLLLRTLRTPALIACGLMFFQRFSGANAFYFYVVSVFKETFGGTNPHSAAVAVALVQLLSSLLSGLLVDSVGRLPLLVASSVLMSLALASFGSFAYYEDAHHHSVPNLDWIPLLCVLVFTVAFSLGISPISWLLVTELFSLEHRGLGTALATSFSYLCSFVGVKTFVDFQELLGLHGAFWLYAAISVCGLCFVVCCVPETKGRDLNEIETGR